MITPGKCQQSHQRRLQVAIGMALAGVAVILGLAMSHKAYAGLQRWQQGQQRYLVYRVDQLKQFKAVLNDKQGQPLHRFDQWNAQLAEQGQQLRFAMNGGMYHPDRRPVGLYIEQGQQREPLNLDHGVGNFFMQPNGVLAWNDQTAYIMTTTQWYQQSRALQQSVKFATQSGPMMVIDQKINPNFLANSTSRKYRNAVAIRDQQLYLILSETRVNFYDMAVFMRDRLKAEQALYLDGSISSLYDWASRYTLQRDDLGVMLGVVEPIQP